MIMRTGKSMERHQNNSENAARIPRWHAAGSALHSPFAKTNVTYTICPMRNDFPSEVDDRAFAAPEHILVYRCGVVAPDWQTISSTVLAGT